MKEIPHTIALQGFLHQRSKDVLSFLNALSNKPRLKFSVNNLHKRLRRRAMSHNRYRIPKRLRLGISDLLDAKQRQLKVPQCRRSLRRSHLLSLEYNKRNNKCRWLNSHIWMSKRMHMINYFGFKVARRPQEKNWRACWRHSIHKSVLFDNSYLRCLIVNRSSWQLEQGVSVIRIGQFDQQLIVQNQALESAVWVHPSSFQRIVAFLQVKSIPFRFNETHSLFRLIGPCSLDILFKAVGVRAWGQIGDPDLLQNGRKQYLRAEMKKEKMISQPSKSEQLAEKIESTSLNLGGVFEQDSGLQWWLSGKQPEIKFQVQTRSRYSHKRTNKKGKKKAGPKSDTPLKKIFKPSINPPACSTLKAQIQLLIIKQRELSSLLIIVHNKLSNLILRKLVYNGVQVIGLDNLQYIKNSWGITTFPEQCPTSQGFQRINLQRTQQSSDSHFNKPPQKRVNLFSISSPFPFSPPNQFLQQFPALYRPIYLKTFRGLPRRYGYICKPSAEDFQNLASAIKTNQSLNLSEPKGPLPESYPKDKSQTLTLLKSVKPSRQIIGWIQNGFFSMRQGCGAGIGWIKEGTDQLVLVRNCLSGTYQAAEWQWI